MAVFLRFLLTVVANFAWQRIGGRGAVPPVKLPRSKQPLNLPVLAPWQMMVAMWVARKFWGRYGVQVKDKLDNANHPAARVVGSLIPDDNIDTQSANKSAKTDDATNPNLQTATPAPRVWTTTAQPATVAAGAGTTVTNAVPDQRDYGTRKLDDSTP